MTFIYQPCQSFVNSNKFRSSSICEFDIVSVHEDEGEAEGDGKRRLSPSYPLIIQALDQQ